MTDRLGSRGGTTATLEEGQARLETARADDAPRIRSAILRTALHRGEFHADDAADWPVSQPNQIGAQVNALAKMGLLEKLNANGEPEHRKARAKASHGRASYVWRLTGKGHVEAARARPSAAAERPQEAASAPKPTPGPGSLLNRFHPRSCGSCGATIVFLKTTKAKAMPLDPEPVEGGNVRIRDGIALVNSDPDLLDDGLRYQSHFASCPNADRHRRTDAA